MNVCMCTQTHTYITESLCCIEKTNTTKDGIVAEETYYNLNQEIINNGYEESVAKAIRDDMAEKGGYGSTKIGPLMSATA